MVECGDVVERCCDVALVVIERRVVLGGEDDQGLALRGVREVLRRAAPRPGRSGCRGREVVGEGAAASGGEQEEGAEDDDPAREGAPRVPCAGEGDRADEPVHRRAFLGVRGLLLMAVNLGSDVVSRAHQTGERCGDLAVRAGPTTVSRGPGTAGRDAPPGVEDVRPVVGDQAVPAPSAPRSGGPPSPAGPATTGSRAEADARLRAARLRQDDAAGRMGGRGRRAAVAAPRWRGSRWTTRDNDPATFWTYVVAALRTAAPAVGTEATGTAGSPQPPPVETVLTSLVNDVGAPEPTSCWCWTTTTSSPPTCSGSGVPARPPAAAAPPGHRQPGRPAPSPPPAPGARRAGRDAGR